jgi:P27 family predicted phage terminase small subunit
LNKREPQPVPLDATLPRHLSWLPPEAKAEWKRVAPELARLSLLSVLDTELLASYCLSYALWCQASKAVEELGLTYTSANGNPRTRPEVAIASAAAKQMVEFAREFGLTPASRTRLSVTPALPNDDDW